MTKRKTLNWYIYCVIHLQVWIWLLFSTIACIGLIWLFYFFYRKYFQDIITNEDSSVSIKLSHIVENLFANLTNHSMQIIVFFVLMCASQVLSIGAGNLPSNNMRSIKVMMFTWCLTTFIVVNVYSSCLTSYLSLIFERPDINSFSDLATNPNYQLATVEASYPEIIFFVINSFKNQETLIK